MSLSEQLESKLCGDQGKAQALQPLPNMVAHQSVSEILGCVTSVQQQRLGAHREVSQCGLESHRCVVEEMGCLELGFGVPCGWSAMPDV